MQIRRASPCLSHPWLCSLPHVPLLEMQHAPVLEHNVGLVWLVAGGNHCNLVHSEPSRELSRRFSKRQAGPQQLRAENMEGEVQVSHIEPGLGVKRGESVTHAKGLAAQAPPFGAVPKPCQGIEDRIHIRANAQPKPGEVIAHIDNNAETPGGNGAGKGRDEASAPEAPGEKNYAGETLLCPGGLRHRFVHRNCPCKPAAGFMETRFPGPLGFYSLTVLDRSPRGQ